MIRCCLAEVGCGSDVSTAMLEHEQFLIIFNSAMSFDMITSCPISDYARFTIPNGTDWAYLRVTLVGTQLVHQTQEGFVRVL